MSSSFQDRPPAYFRSSQQLVGPQHGASRLESAAENPGMQVMARPLLGAGREGAHELGKRLVMAFAWGKRCWAALLVLSHNFGKCCQHVKNPE